jgi:hypothetical protein
VPETIAESQKYDILPSLPPVVPVAPPPQPPPPIQTAHTDVTPAGTVNVYVPGVVNNCSDDSGADSADNTTLPDVKMLFRFTDIYVL